LNKNNLPQNRFNKGLSGFCFREMNRSATLHDLGPKAYNDATKSGIGKPHLLASVKPGCLKKETFGGLRNG
jgi:hypothetical protein